MSQPHTNSEQIAKPPNNKFRRFGKRITQLCLLLLGLLLIVLLLVGGALFTNTGLSAILWGAHKFVPELKIEKAQGALLDHFVLQNISYKSSELGVDTFVERVELGLDLDCIMSASLCIDRLNVDGLDLALVETNTEPAPSEPSDPLTYLFIPIPIELRSLALNDIQLNILDNQVSWQSFTTSIELFGNDLTISPTALNQLTVALAKSTETAKPTETVQSREEESSHQAPSKIELPEVIIPLNIELIEFALNHFQLKGETPIVIHQAKLAMQADQHDVAIKRFELDMPQVQADLTGDIQLVGDYLLSMKLFAELNIDPLRGQKIALELKNSIAQLQWKMLFEQLITGELKGEIAPLQPSLPFDVSMREFKAFWPLQTPAQYNAHIATLNLNGDLDGYQFNANLDASGDSIPDLLLAISGEGSLEHIQLSQLQLDTLGGKINAQAEVNWSALANWQAQLEFEQLQPGLQWEQAEGDLSGRLHTEGNLTQQGGWVVNLPMLDVKGILRDYPLTLKGELYASDIDADGQIKLHTQELSLSHAVNQLTINGELEEQWQMEVALDFPDLEQTAPIQGALAGKIHLTGAFAEPIVEFALNGQQLNYNEQLNVEQFGLDGEVTPLPIPHGQLALVVDNINANGQLINQIKLSFQGTQQQHSLTLAMDSELINGGFKIAGGIEDESQLQWLGSLQNAEFTTMQGHWELDSPPQIGFDIEKQKLSLDSHCWLQADSSVCLKKDLLVSQSGEISVGISHFNFSQLKAFIPSQTQLEGEFDVDLYAKWQPETPIEASAQLQLSAGQVTQKLERPLVLAWHSMLLEADFKQDNLHSKLMIDIVDNGAIEGQFNLLQASTQQQIDARLLLQSLNLDPLKPLWGEFSQVSANINSDITLSGSPTKPKVKGQLTIADIVAMGDITPLELKEGDFVIRFEDYHAKLNSNLSTPEGELNIEGAADWNDMQNWRSNLVISADELLVDVKPIVTAKVEPKITIAASPHKIKLDGIVNLPYGRIIVQELPESAISVSNDEIIVNKDLQPIAEEERLPIEVESNIQINIGDDFTLSAFGLRGGLIGTLDVTQKNKAPFILGEVNVVDGAYRSFGQDLIIDEGKILFNGPADQPYLSIKAIRNPDNTEDDVIAGIRVTGPADNPEVSIFSEPAMPQANALSYVMRGQDLNSESGGNAMTTALIGLSLAKSGRVVGEIGEAFGVKDLQLDTAGSGDDSQVTVSGYILPDLQVKYGVGIFDAIGEFTLRYRLMKDLYLEAVSGADNAVDLLYQFQF